ncbi:MAG TPA: hypothetical protein ENK02_01105 [Planctomycetes bacterium]|nr:hypothetical protein [Planctomycetota bacterium]
MRVLLDECLPRRLKPLLGGHNVQTVPEAGWSGKKNGDLLRVASESFDAFITMDQNLQYQQNLKVAELAVIVLECRTNRFEDLLPLVPRLLDLLREGIAPGEIVRIGV